jgi:uncharacterized protein YukE
MSVLESLFEEYQQLKNLVSEFEKTNQELQAKLEGGGKTDSSSALELLKAKIAELEAQNQELMIQLTEQAKLLAEKDKEIALLSAKLNVQPQPSAIPEPKNHLPSQAAQSQPTQQYSTTEALSVIENSGLFDKTWYLQHYPDVAKSGMNPAEHYLLFGMAEMRNPGPGFNTASYLRQHPELLRSKVNPIIHYVKQRSQKV